MVQIRGDCDSDLELIAAALSRYEGEHEEADVVAYRQNSVSVRIRIVDPDFLGVSKAERHDQVWSLLESLPEDVQSQVTLLLPLTPDETSESFANYEFDHPIPSTL